MVEPTGVDAIIEIAIPRVDPIIERIAEQIVTDLKLLNTLIAESAGKITNAEIKSDPTKFIANTIITAMIIAMIRLYTPAFVPVALANDSSKVTQNILL